MRAAGVLAAGVALGVPAWGCSSTGGTAGGAGEPVQLVYQDWRTEWFPAMAQEQLAQFHASHPGIRVFYTPDPESDRFQEKMLADMKAGTAADVFQGCCAHFPTWAQKGYTLDLRSYVERDLTAATIDDWDPAQYRSFFAPDGRQFGVPKYHGALALFYNKDLFDAAKVDYPDDTWNYDDYVAAMRLLTVDRDDDGVPEQWGGMLHIDWDRLQVHVNAWGGHFVDPADPSRCLMAGPQALAALDWVRARMWDDRVMPAAPDVQNRGITETFTSGLVAMVEDGSWALREILDKARFRVGLAPMPAGPAGRVSLATTDGFGVYARSRHPAEAWELVKFLIGPEYGRAMAKANFLQPARLSLVGDWVGYIRDEYPLQAGDLDINVFADGQRQGYSVTAEVFPHDQATASRLAAAAWERIFTLGEDPVSILVGVAAAIEEAQKAGA